MISFLLFCWFLGIVGLAIGVAARVTTLREIHHSYVGTLFLVLALAIYLFGGASWLAWTFFAVGAYLALDDGIEHATAAAAGSADDAWSPIHSYLVPVLYRSSWFRSLEAFLDRLFGKVAPPV